MRRCLVVLWCLAACKHTPRSKEPEPTTHEPPGATQAAVLVADGNATCRASQGAVACWGYSAAGPRTRPVAEKLAPTRDVALGASQVCGRTADHVFCTSPGLDAALPAGVAQLLVTGTSACVRTEAGQVSCWGESPIGLLGDGASTHAAPTPVPGLTGVVSLAMADDQACAVDRSGKVWCWGLSWMQHELAPGVTCTTSYKPPHNLPPGAVGQTEGALRFVGDTPDMFVCERPGAVSGVDDAVKVAVTRGRACVVTRAGTVRCWDSQSVTDVPGLTGVAEVALGMDHTCARLADGTVRCWGGNDFGQLGDGTTNRSASPVVAGVTGAVGLALGLQHSCALLGDGGVRCWGVNAAGQLGDGSTENRATPVAVAF